MKCHTLPHKMVQKVFWSIDKHISFSSNQQNKAQEVYLFFHRKKAYIRLCSRNISPVNIISFLSKKQMIVMKHRTIAWKSSRDYKHFTIENKANKLTLCHKGKAKQLNINYLALTKVRLIGLEPTRHKPLDPKSSASTNFATSALLVQRYNNILR